MHARLFILIIIATATGCPESSTQKQTTTSTTAAPTTSSIVRRTRAPATPEPTKSAAPEWRDDAQFPRAAIAEIYRAEQLAPEAERRAVLAKHGLADESGKAVVEKVQAYERALKRFATERADEWSALVADVEEARAKVAAPPVVEKH